MYVAGWLKEDRCVCCWVAEGGQVSVAGWLKEDRCVCCWVAEGGQVCMLLGGWRTGVSVAGWLKEDRCVCCWVAEGGRVCVWCWVVGGEQVCVWCWVVGGGQVCFCCWVALLTVGSPSLQWGGGLSQRHVDGSSTDVSSGQGPDMLAGGVAEPLQQCWVHAACNTLHTDHQHCRGCDRTHHSVSMCVRQSHPHADHHHCRSCDRGQHNTVYQCVYYNHTPTLTTSTARAVTGHNTVYQCVYYNHTSTLTTSTAGAVTEDNTTQCINVCTTITPPH